MLPDTLKSSLNRQLDRRQFLTRQCVNGSFFAEARQHAQAAADLLAVAVRADELGDAVSLSARMCCEESDCPTIEVKP